MYENVTSFVSGITVFFGLVAVILFIKLFSAWRNIDEEFIKARVFLIDKFIMKNIVVVFVVGILVVIHNFIEYMGLGYPEFYFGVIAAKYPSRLFAVTELLTAILLVDWLMYQWILISKK